jgi:hypothetical protein
MGVGCRGERRRPKIEEVGAVVGLVTAGGVVGALPQARATVRDGRVVLEVADEDGGHHAEEELIGVEVVTWRNSSNGAVVRRTKGRMFPLTGPTRWVPGTSALTEKETFWPIVLLELLAC